MVEYGQLTDPELAIGTDKVCALILQGRAYHGRVARTAELGVASADHSDWKETEDRPDDDTLGQIREFLAGLTEDEAAHLLALLWLGRGDIELDDWAVAVGDAADRLERRDVAFPVDDPLFPEALATALDRLGVACEPE